METILFATNRNPINSSVRNNFGTDFNESGEILTFGRAEVRDLDREGDLSEANLSIADCCPGRFPRAMQDAIVDGPDHVLVSIHGFDYRFREAVMRAAWLNRWFRFGTPPVESTMILFSWPSLGSLTTAGYAADWDSATRSGTAFRLFLQALLPVLESFRAQRVRRRVTLLAHSMGARVLSAGLRAALGTAPGQYDPTGQEPIFDRALLVAADEDSEALSRPDGLARLNEIADSVHVYYNRQDIPLRSFSRLHHGSRRLGADGPPDKHSFRDLGFVFVDCSAANPNDANAPDDPQRHQYYRLIPEVRDDLCAVMAGEPDFDLPNRTYREEENYHRLDIAPRPALEDLQFP